MDKYMSKKNIILYITYLVILLFAFFNIEKIMGAIGYFANILSPIFVAVIIAFIMNLLLKLIENKILGKIFRKSKFFKKHSRAICLTITVILISLILYGFVMFAIPNIYESIISIGSKIPEFTQDTVSYLKELTHKINIPPDIAIKIESSSQGLFNGILTSITNLLPDIINIFFGMTTSVFNFIMSFILAIYMVFSKEHIIKIIKSIIYAMFKKGKSDKIIQIGHTTNTTFSRFVSGQLIQAVVLAVLCFIGMSIFNMPYALLISIITGVTALIPYLGAYIGAVPSIFIVFTENPLTALYFAIFIFIIQQINGSIIYPKIVGRGIGLNGLWVLISIIVFGNIFGIFGMIIGVPMFAIFYIVIKEIIHDKLKEKNINDIDKV